MRMAMRVLTVLIVLGLFLVPTGTALAKGLSEGKVVFGGTYTLKSGETLDGDLLIMGGIVLVENGAIVKGDVVLLGGNLSMNGEMTGNLAVIGGAVSLGEQSLVGGDVGVVGGSLQRQPGAQVEGEVTSSVPFPWMQGPYWYLPSEPIIHNGISPFSGMAQALGTAITLAILAMLAALFLASPLERVGRAVTGEPVVAGGLGLLVVVLTPFVLVMLILLSLTIIFIPVLVAFILALMLAWLMGILALGMEVGLRFTQAVKVTWAPVLTAGFGTFLLMLASGVIGLIPCLGLLANTLLAMLGIGGVLMTSFGARPHRPSRPAAPAVVPPVVPPAS